MFTGIQLSKARLAQNLVNDKCKTFGTRIQEALITIAFVVSGDKEIYSRSCQNNWQNTEVRPARQDFYSTLVFAKALIRTWYKIFWYRLANRWLVQQTWTSQADITTVRLISFESTILDFFTRFAEQQTLPSLIFIYKETSIERLFDGYMLNYRVYNYAYLAWTSIFLPL